MFILDSIGFGSAFALLIPLSYTPDVAFEISGAWFAAPSVIIMFYFLNIFGQFISSSNRKIIRITFSLFQRPVVSLTQ